MNIDDLPAVPDLAMSPERVEAMRAALVREIGTAGPGPSSARVDRPLLPAGLLGRPRLRVAAGLALGVLAATLALNYGPSGQASAPAVSGWDYQAVLVASATAVPTTATPAEADSVLAACVSPASPRSFQVDDAERQGGVYIVMATRSGPMPSAVVCVGELESAHDGGAFEGGTFTADWPDPAGEGQQVDSIVTQELTSFRPYSAPGPALGPNDQQQPSMVIGRVSPDVTSVKVQTADPASGGTVHTVQAEIGGGIYLAWWPEQYAYPTKITAFAANGSVLKTLQAGPITFSGR